METTIQRWSVTEAMSEYRKGDADDLETNRRTVKRNFRWQSAAIGKPLETYSGDAPSPSVFPVRRIQKAPYENQRAAVSLAYCVLTDPGFKAITGGCRFTRKNIRDLTYAHDRDLAFLRSTITGVIAVRSRYTGACWHLYRIGNQYYGTTFQPVELYGVCVPEFDYARHKRGAVCEISAFTFDS